MIVEQHLEVGVDGVVPGALVVEVLGEHLDVAGLVHDLGGRVVLGVDPRHRLDDPGRTQQRPLLAVHELAQPPVLPVDDELGPLLLAELLERRSGRLGDSRNRWTWGLPPISPASCSTSTSVSHGRSVSPFHCECLAFS
jgi:hypothetical protein